MIERAARALLSLGCFISIGSFLAFLGTPEGSAERIVSTIALLLGIGITAASVVVLMLTVRHRQRGADISEMSVSSDIRNKEEK